MDITELVFEGRDNDCRVQFLEDGAPFDSGPVTRTVLEWGNGQPLIDSAQTPDAITWESNTLVLSLGNANVDPGNYPVRVIVYTPQYPDGLVIWSEFDDPQLWVRVVR